ncbi:SCO2524 family protein [Parafrankia discariae]|uniref:SCO2524 family protein n=1 Tax=Parafrankia discariae TaxID=365528 RepID=UPI0003A74716|nr:SCO2524 family protein [Parafrankia discariae]
MDIRPRQLLLEMWESAVEYSYPSGEWKFGGRAESNSTSDAEQLLCLMYPSYQMTGMEIVKPDETAKDVRDALKRIGDARQIPQIMVQTLGEYFGRYTNERKAPVFAGGSYFQSAGPDETPTPEQQALEIVDSFSMSITLSLAVLGFVREFRSTVRRDALLAEMLELERAASRRLTASMVGLLRCFTVRTFTPYSEEGRALCDLVNTEQKATEKVLDELRDALVPARTSLRELKLGVELAADVVEDDGVLFECGWSWGIIREAPPVELESNVDVYQAPGVALAKPSLYFTVVALDGIADLFSERTRRLGLINPDQESLVGALQLRSNLARIYWSTIARLGRGRWPVEEVPWRGADPAEEGPETDYDTLLAASITIEALASERARDVDIARIGEVLAELAVRGRVTRRARQREPAIGLHVPGVRLVLTGAEDLGPPLVWPVADFSTALLKRVARAASITRDSALRDRLVALADEIWKRHVRLRQLADPPGAGLWDDTSLLNVPPTDKGPSWYFTERVMEALVTVAALTDRRPYSPTLAELALDMLAEADHLHMTELLRESPTAALPARTQLHGIGANLRRARELRERQPATSISIVQAALRDLDALAVARQA